MSGAAKIVLWVLAFVVISHAIASLIYPFFRLEMTKAAEQAYNLALGALIGVIAKTGLDAAQEELMRRRDARKEGDPVNTTETEPK